MHRLSLILMVGLAAGSGTACGSSERAAGARWAGTVDTLPTGQIVVTNPDAPIWPPGGGWQVVEELRIGRADGDGPELFGQVISFEVDPAGRIWIFDGQAQELRVFKAGGEHVRTVGRRGSGPGEFAQAVRVELGPDRNIWVMDPQNNRLSVFDTAGAYLEGKRALGGFIMIPWPGRFDQQARYYAPVPRRGRDFHLAMVRHDTSFTPIDTLEVPRDPSTRDRFEHRTNGGGIIAGVPFTGNLVWRISPAGTIWALVTDQYRLFELDAAGDTLRTITRAFSPLPVTAADRDQAREDLRWFTEQGGQPDWSKIPSQKPPTRSFFVEDARHLWVEVVTTPEDAGRVFDIFDPDGRYLGAVRLPFALARSPVPIIRNGALYGVTRDELEVPYLVRARIVEPGTGEG